MGRDWHAGAMILHSIKLGCGRHCLVDENSGRIKDLQIRQM
jgi:hypothetical protein